MHRVIVRSVPLALVLTVLVACASDDDGGGSGETSAAAPAGGAAPAEYVEGLCTAITAYQQDLIQQGSTFQDEMSAGSPTPQQTKDALSAFLGDAAARTRQLIDEVKALGVPGVDNGDEVRSTFASAFDRVVELFETTRAEVERLSADDPAALAQGFAEAGAKLQQAGSEIGESFADLSSPELDEAAAEAQSCAAIT